MSDQADETFGMTDLEEALRGPDGPAVRERLLLRIDQLRQEFDAEIMRGVSADTFRNYQYIHKSLAAARDIVLASGHSSDPEGR